MHMYVGGRVACMNEFLQLNDLSTVRDHVRDRGRET